MHNVQPGTDRQRQRLRLLASDRASSGSRDANRAGVPGATALALGSGSSQRAALSTPSPRTASNGCLGAVGRASGNAYRCRSAGPRRRSRRRDAALHAEAAWRPSPTCSSARPSTAASRRKSTPSDICWIRGVRGRVRASAPLRCLPGMGTRHGRRRSRSVLERSPPFVRCG